MHPGYSYPYGWLKLEMGTKMLSMILCLLVNYAHLAWTLKKTQKSRNWLIYKLILAFLLPTLPLAENLIYIWKTFVMILRMDPDQLSFGEIFKDKARYICSALGMYLSPHPEEEEGEQPSTTAAVDEVALVNVQDPSDLCKHKKPWNALAVLRLVAVISLAIAPGPFIFLGVNYAFSESSYKARYMSTIVGNSVCSLSALMAICFRSEWSMVHLPTSQPRKQSYFYHFAFELIIAAVAYEGIYLSIEPFGYYFNALPASFLCLLGALAYVLAFNFPVWILVVLAVWQLRQRIVDATKINWRLIFHSLLVIAMIWISIDSVCFLFNDIDSLVR